MQKKKISPIPSCTYFVLVGNILNIGISLFPQMDYFSSLAIMKHRVPEFFSRCLVGLYPTARLFKKCRRESLP